MPLRDCNLSSVIYDLPHNTLKGTARSGVELLGDASGQKRQSSSLRGMIHGLCHCDWILGLCDSGIH